MDCTVLGYFGLLYTDDFGECSDEGVSLAL